MSIKVSEMSAAPAPQDTDLIYFVSGGVSYSMTWAALVAAMGGYPAGTKFYRVLLSQSGTSAPTAAILQNTLGVDPVLTRANAGEYLLTAAGKFPTKLKTFVRPGSLGSATAMQCFWNDANSIVINTPNTADVFTDDLLDATAFEIIVFP